jgi:hypothetical protein
MIPTIEKSPSAPPNLQEESRTMTIPVNTEERGRFASPTPFPLAGVADEPRMTPETGFP